MRSKLFWLSTLYLFLYVRLTAGDIPGIPKWAQKLAKCGVDDTEDDQKSQPRHAPGMLGNLIKMKAFPTVPPILKNLPKVPSFMRMRQKRFAYADDSKSGIKKWPFLARFEFAEMQNWFQNQRMISPVGTLITPDMVLTARHVIDNIDPAYQKKITKVVLGSNTRWQMVPMNDVQRSMVDAYYHPNPMIDLGIIKLSAPATCGGILKTPIGLVNLANSTFDDLYECTSASWGKNENGECPKNLKTAKFTLFNQEPGKEYEVCTRGVNQTTSRVGDSGAPLMCREPTTGRWLQYGIMSYDYWSTDYKVSCFISVPHTWQWIQQIINQHSEVQTMDDLKAKCSLLNNIDLKVLPAL